MRYQRSSHWPLDARIAVVGERDTNSNVVVAQGREIAEPLAEGRTREWAGAVHLPTPKLLPIRGLEQGSIPRFGGVLVASRGPVRQRLTGGSNRKEQPSSRLRVSIRPTIKSKLLALIPHANQAAQQLGEHVFLASRAVNGCCNAGNIFEEGKEWAVDIDCRGYGGDEGAVFYRFNAISVLVGIREALAWAPRSDESYLVLRPISKRLWRFNVDGSYWRSNFLAILS